MTCVDCSKAYPEMCAVTSVFNDPEMVKRQLGLPAIVSYSFVGENNPRYHALVEEILVRIAGNENIRKRGFRESSKGKYTAYRYDVYHDDFQDIEAIYREVGELEGTRFVI